MADTLIDLMDKPKTVKDEFIPKRIRLKSNQVWCPYCSTPVVLVKDKRRGIRKCPICGISNKDYWIKKVNSGRREKCPLVVVTASKSVPTQDNAAMRGTQITLDVNIKKIY